MSFISDDYINSIERGYGDSDKKLCHECIGNKSVSYTHLTLPTNSLV